MWGTDGIRIETVDEGWVWMFSAVDHFDACCAGIHGVKIGNRFAALQPIAQGLLAEFGATGADAGRGLTLRMDHGTQYTADGFPNQVKFWGIAPSFACVTEPQTNGVAEPFNQTLKEQAIHGRIFRNVEEVHTAVATFRIGTIVIGVSKNWASCHPSKPVRLMPCERPPELHHRVQTIRAGTSRGV